MKRLLVSFCWLLALGCAELGCTKPKYPVIIPLVLTAPFTITPASTTIQLGDTLWLEGNFSDSLLDLNSGKRYRIRPQDVALSTFFAIDELHGRGQKLTGFASTFRVVEQVGQATVNGAYTGRFSMVYSGHSYRVKFGLVSTKRGTAAISLLFGPPGGANAFGNFFPLIQFPNNAQGQEQKAVLDMMYFIVNDGKANNYDLYRQQFTLDPETSGGPEKTLFFGRNSRPNAKRVVNLSREGIPYF